MSIALTDIFIYPVKSLQAINLKCAKVCPSGLANDRRWVIVGPEGDFLSQRSCPSLAQVSVEICDNGLVLHAGNKPPLWLATPSGNRRQRVSIWRDEVDAAAVPEADQWLSEFLGQRCHLAWMDANCRRPITSDAGRPGETVSFADGYPCLMIGEASLADLNRRLSAPVPMARFRPNLVIAGAEPFAEDNWQYVSIGTARFRNAGSCARCNVTTIDQITGQTSAPEPLQTLATFRQSEKGVLFGVNLVVDIPGQIKVGDELKFAD